MLVPPMLAELNPAHVTEARGAGSRSSKAAVRLAPLVLLMAIIGLDVRLRHRFQGPRVCMGARGQRKLCLI